MSFYPSSKILFIYGGRNDQLYETTHTILLDDICILDLVTMIWYPTCCGGSIPKVSRYSHFSTIQSSDLYIFGGMSENSYLSADIRIIELSNSFSDMKILN